MADTKITGLTADASPTTDDLLITVNDPGGTPANRKVTIDNVLALKTTITGNAGTATALSAGDDRNKLDGIEALADVTDTANVTSAGALMDSELADITAIKTLLAPDNTTISTFGATIVDDADAGAVRTTIGAAATSHTHTKSDLTDIADFLLESEVDADIKTLSLPANTTITAAAQTVLDDATVGAMVNTLGGASSTGTGGLVRATSPAITTPTGIVKGDVGLGNVDNTSNATERAATATLTNKRVNPRTASSTTSASLTPDLSSANIYFRTTQTETLTIGAPTGTPVVGETIMIYIDSASAQTLTINATYVAFGAAFPAQTTAGKTFMMSCQYNGTNWKTLWANAQ